MCIRLCVSALWCAMLLMVPAISVAQEIRSGSTSLVQRIAPGEVLPLEIELANFGNNARTDVTIVYEILAQDETLVHSVSETVAVETTAQFIKDILLPSNVGPGNYVVRTRIIYDGQQVPATASYQFSIEQKILGVYVSDIPQYALLILALIGAGSLAYHHRRETRVGRVLPYDYSAIPKDKRLYYEIIGDTIQQMRLQQGKGAIDVASDIPGLTIDPAEGYVERISGEPSEVLAEIVRRYKATYNRNVSFSLGPNPSVMVNADEDPISPK